MDDICPNHFYLNKPPLTKATIISKPFVRDGLFVYVTFLTFYLVRVSQANVNLLLTRLLQHKLMLNALLFGHLQLKF